MARDAAGTYTAPTNSFNPAVEGATIDESAWNATLQDIEDALTDSLSVSGDGKITAHIDFDETTVSSPAANVGRLYAADVGGQTSPFWKDSGGNAYNLLLSTPGLALTFSSSTTINTDPGAGIIRFNDATLALVTGAAIDDVDASGNSISALLQALAVNTYVIFTKRSGAGYAVYTLAGSSNESGYTGLTLAHVASSGTFAANDPISFSFGPAGAAGVSGLNWRSAWLTSTAYAVNDGVSNDSSSWICIQAHTSDAASEPGVGGSYATYWEILAAQGADGAGTGDVVGPAASVDSEIALFSSTTGKLIKRASLTGLVKATSGVASAATAGTDYVAPGGALGTPSSGTGTNLTGIPIATGISGLGTGVATALAVNVGSAGAPVVLDGALGTPSSGTLTNATGLPISTGVSGLGTGVATILATANTSSGSVGYLNVPLNSQSAAYTTVASDAGKAIFHPSADTSARTWTIDSNANVAYPTGTVLTFINQVSAGVITIAITSDTLTLAGAGTTGSRTLAANGMATAIKMTSTTWLISGSGLT